MTRVRVHNFATSIDGFGAGPRQTREEPLGVGGEALHEWSFPTRTFQRMGGKTGGTTGVDDEFAARFGDGVGAWIMGRNMLAPSARWRAGRRSTSSGGRSSRIPETEWSWRSPWALESNESCRTTLPTFEESKSSLESALPLRVSS